MHNLYIEQKCSSNFPHQRLIYSILYLLCRPLCIHSDFAFVKMPLLNEINVSYHSNFSRLVKFRTLLFIQILCFHWKYFFIVHYNCFQKKTIYFIKDITNFQYFFLNILEIMMQDIYANLNFETVSILTSTCIMKTCKDLASKLQLEYNNLFVFYTA